MQSVCNSSSAVRGGKRCLMLAALAFGGALSAPVSADQGFYLGMLGAVSVPPDADLTVTDGTTTVSGAAEFKEGPVAGLLAGYTFASGFRTEVELNYRRNDFDAGGGDVRATQANASVFYNFSRNGYYFYLGGGPGYTSVRLSADDFDADSDNALLWTVGTGFGLPVGNHWMVGVDYRYSQTFERLDFITEPVRGQYQFKAHTVGLALRYSFGSARADSYPVRPSEPVSVVPVGN